MVYRLSSACAPASRNRNREVLAVPGAYSKSEFGPCAPVVATLLTDWGWRELGGRVGRRSPSVARNTSGASSTRSEEHTSELQSHSDLVCRLLLEKKKKSTQSSSVGSATSGT